MSHSRIFPLEYAPTTVVPSGLNVMLLTLDASPVMILRHVPVFASHNRRVPSVLPLASILLLLANATLLILNVCPSKVLRYVPSFASHKRTAPSLPRLPIKPPKRLPLARIALSGLNAILLIDACESGGRSIMVLRVPVLVHHKLISPTFPLAIFSPSPLNARLKTLERGPLSGGSRVLMRVLVATFHR